MADKTVIVEINYDTAEGVKNLDNLTAAIEGEKVAQAKLKAELEAGKISQKEYSIQVEQSKEVQSKANTERKATIQLLGAEKGSINELKAAIKQATSERDKINKTTKEGKEAYEAQNKKIIDYKKALKDAEGQTKLASGAFGTLRDGLSKLPGPLGGVVNGFGGMVSAMWKFIATPVGAAITAVVVSATALYSIFSKFDPVADKVSEKMAGFSGILDVMEDRIIQVFTGARKLSNIFESFADDARTAAEEAMRLKRAEQDLEDQQKFLIVNSEKYKRQIDELILQSKNRTLSEEERIKLIDEALKIEEQAYNEKKNIADKEVELAWGAILRGKQLTDKQKERLNEEGLNYAFYLQKKGKITDEDIERLANSLAKQEQILDESVAIREKALNRQDVLEQAQSDREAKRAEEAKKRSEENQKIVDDAIAETERLNAIDAKKADEKKKREEDEAKRRADAIASIADSKSKELELFAKTEYEKASIQIDAADAELARTLENKNLTDTEIQAAQEAHNLKLLEIDAAYQESLKQQHEQMLQDSFDSMQQIIAATQDMGDRRVAIIADSFSKISTINFKETKNYADAFAQIAQGAMSLTNLITQGHEQELNDLETKKAHELKLVGDNKAAQAKINKKYAKKEAELKRQQAIEDKVKASIDVFLATSIAVAKSIAASPLTVGLPWSAIIAGLGAAEIAAIVAKPLPDFKSEGVYAKGGMIGGKSHAQGGTKFYGTDGSMFEAEKGEAMFVMKKDATAEIAALSMINESKGGRSFIGSGSSHLAEGGGVEPNNLDLGKIIKEAMKDVSIVVDVGSIETGLTNYRNVKKVGVI